MNEATILAEKLKSNQGGRYPEALRLEATDYILRCRDADQSWYLIQKKLNIGKTTIQNWYAKARQEKPIKLQPVKVKSCASESESRQNKRAIVSPEGWRIEGLRLDEIKEIFETIGH